MSAALKGRRAQQAKIDEEIRQVLHVARQRKPPEPLLKLSAAFVRDAQAHADYWREAYAAVQDKTTGIITLVTDVRASYVTNARILQVYKPTEAPADQWPNNPLCHPGVTQGIETVPGFALPSATPRTVSAADKGKFDRPSVGDGGIGRGKISVISARTACLSRL